MKPENLFNDIEKFVGDSRAMLKQGTLVELSGLENRILILCEEVAILSQDERLHYAPRLQQLMADLTALGEEITAQRDAVAEEIRQLPGHKKAHAAYRVIEATDEEEK